MNLRSFITIRVLASVFVAALAVSTWLYALAAVSQLEVSRGQLRKTKEGLQRRLQKMGGTELEGRARARWEEVEAFRARLLSLDEGIQFERRLGQIGEVENLGFVRLDEYSRRRFRVVRRNEPMSAWFPWVQAIKSIQAVPGASVRRLNVQAAGGESDRSFVTLEIEVTIAVHNEAAEQKKT